MANQWSVVTVIQKCTVSTFNTPRQHNFAMQVGCGVDRHSYAMEYARSYKPQALGCGVVIDGVKAFVEPYNNQLN